MDIPVHPRVGDIERALVRRQGEPVGILDGDDRLDAVVRRDTIDLRASPDVLHAFRTGNFAVGKSSAQRRVGEVDAAVAVTDDVVRPVETAALEAVDQSCYGAVQFGAGDVARLAFAMDQPALQIEGHAIAADRLADHLRLFAEPHLVERTRPDIVEVPEVVGMPQRPLGKDETGRLARHFGGFENIGQAVHVRTFRVAGRVYRQDRRRPLKREFRT